MRTVPVLIAGGGPVGLTLAHELARHEVGCLVVERNATTTAHPKMDLTNSRTMELYQRLGVAELVRSVGVPPDNPFDVLWCSSPTGTVLHRFAYPSQTERWRQLRDGNDGTQPAEPPVRISQIVLEPALVGSLRTKPTVQHRFGTALEGFVQDAHGVTALLRDAEGRTEQVRARYLVGCDGGGSTVRRVLGIGLDGTPGVRPSYMVHFRSRRHDVLQHFGIVWHTQHATGTIIAQDDDRYWTLQARPPQDVDPATLDPAAVLRGFLGVDIDAEVLVANPWVAHLLVAERYRHGRVFLCGDAAHQFIPTGGYGMNTGVADAVDLGWKLAAVLEGWGGEALLDSYDAERRPVALRNRDASGRHAGVRADIARLYAAHPHADRDAEQAAALGAAIAATGNAENEQWGIEHGYRYAASPVIPDAVADSDFDPATYRPSCEPGGRLPSVFLEDGTNLHRRLGRGFTLVCVGDVDPGPVTDAAAALGIPFGLVRLDVGWSRVYDRALLLVRPDHHLAWSAARAPADWATVLRTACGLPPDRAWS